MKRHHTLYWNVIVKGCIIKVTALLVCCHINKSMTWCLSFMTYISLIWVNRNNFRVVHKTEMLGNNDFKGSFNKLLLLNTKVRKKTQGSLTCSLAPLFHLLPSQTKHLFSAVPRHTGGNWHLSFVFVHTPFFAMWWRDTLKSHSCQQSFF